MKKMLFIAAVASVALASCTNDENTFEGVKNGREVSFVAADYANQSRAEHDINLAFSNTDYKVWAWFNGGDEAYINALIVNADGSYAGDTYYWPDEALDFAAVSPATDPRITVSRDAVGATTVTYKFDGVNENTTTTNLMHADFVEGQTKTTPTVALGFRHALAKLNVVLHQNAVAVGSLPTGVSGYEVVLKNVRINGILCQGTFTVTANAQNTTDRVWDASTATTDWNILTSATQSIKAADYATTADYYVMPQTLADATTITIDYDVIATLTSGGTSKLEKTATVELNDIYKAGSATDKITDWFTNKVITYTFNINPTSELTPIAFTAQEEEWGTVGGSHTF